MREFRAWQPEGNHQVKFLDYVPFMSYVPVEKAAIPCTSTHTLESASKCIGCKHEVSVFLAALFTFLLHGPDDAAKWYGRK